MDERKVPCVLFVGEGDFSFSANYIETRNHNEKIYATCLSDGFLTEEQKKNIEIIQENGGFVYCDVDATCLDSHPEIKKLKFIKIIFNFPHIPGKMNIRKNRQLVEQFLMSGRKILKSEGTIWVTLCKGQGGTEAEKVKRKWCDTWQIVSLAASSSLYLQKIKVFDENSFKTYRSTGFRGLQKPFNTKDALTHIFKIGIQVDFVKDVNNYLDRELYLQHSKTLYRNIGKQLNHPIFKMKSILNDIAMKVFPSVHLENINDLITCKKPSSNSNLKTCTINLNDFCENCLQNLLFSYLNKKKNGLVCIDCVICCIEEIDINKSPLHHLVSYFSNDIEYLLNRIPTFLENFTNVFNIGGSDKVAIQNIVFNSKKIIQTSLQAIGQSKNKKFTAKNVLNINAKYSLTQGDELFFFSDVEFILMDPHSETKLDNILKIGTIVEFDYNLKKYCCISFDLNLLACVKFHVIDFRTLLSQYSFYSSEIIRDCSVEVYRSLGLYAPTYAHDTSFYIDKHFSENNFFLVVRNIVGYLIKSVRLIDSYYDETQNKQSRCYQFIYQSCDQILSKDKASAIHSNCVRKALAKSLSIILR